MDPHRNAPDDDQEPSHPPLPNFLGIGVQRGGTTWVHECLRRHPQVFLPAEKELQFFNFGYDKGLDSYRQCFAGWRGQPAIGEITPNYYHSAKALERIRQDLPGIRLFIVFRDPVERAFSHYQLMDEHQFKGLSFRQAIEQKPFLMDRGRYNQTLKMIYGLFDPSQVLVCLYDDLACQPQAFLQRLCAFLGVDDQFVPETINQRYNRIVYERAQNTLKAMKLHWAVDLVKKTPVSGWIKRHHQKSGPRIKPRDAAYVRDLYRQDMLEFEQMIGRDLSAWLGTRPASAQAAKV
jgi:hypothetical protein